MDWLPWILVLLLAGAAVGLMVLWRRQVALVRAKHHAQVTELAEAHQAKAEQEATLHRRALEETQTALEDLERRASDAAAEAAVREEQLHRFLASALDYDLGSRMALLAACAKVPLDGALMSNVVFLRRGSEGNAAYRRQIDHLIVTRSKVFLIENKGWKGLVFDGVRPSVLHRDLGAVVDERELGEHFAVHIGGNGAKIRTETEGPEGGRRVPVIQAGRQVADLKDIFAEKGLGLPWIEACVFYSHADVRLRAHDQQTTWKVRVFDRSGLDAVLKSGSGNGGIDVERMVEALEPHSGDIVGFGRFRAAWPARF